VSRLGSRLERLEQTFPPCQTCAEWRRRAELVTSARPVRKAPEQDCRECGETVEATVLMLAFDPDHRARREQP
jgi:hypothetical protein